MQPSPLPPRTPGRERTRPGPPRPPLPVLLLLSATLGQPAVALATEQEARGVPQHLRDTGLYADWQSRTVHPDNLPFRPQYPLWSDGARKQRWLFLPRGTSIRVRAPDRWEFPIGTRLWKEFRFAQRVETRYITRSADGWRFATYVWTADGRDALLAPEEGLPDHLPLASGAGYDVPGTHDCKACHEGRPTPVLGVSALQLSPDRDPLAAHTEPPVPGEVDLHGLLARGLLRGAPASWRRTPPRITAGRPVARAAMGYLHGNCGNCHNDGGPLAFLGLGFWHSGARGGEDEAPALRTAVDTPLHTPLAGLAGALRIHAGAPEHSGVLLRMRSRQALTQMPPFGSSLADAAGLQLVEQWIQEVPPRGGPHPRGGAPKGAGR